MVIWNIYIDRYDRNRSVALVLVKVTLLPGTLDKLDGITPALCSPALAHSLLLVHKKHAKYITGKRWRINNPNAAILVESHWPHLPNPYNI